MIPTSPAIDLGEILNRTYRGKRVFVTGHNGFVGSWLTRVLSGAGAEVTGFSLPRVKGGIAELIEIDQMCHEVNGDICDAPLLTNSMRECNPEIVFHLAAQPLVLPSFDDPIYTLATNVLGTAHVFESLKAVSSARSCVVVTSDKCYATATGAHDESDPFGGDDIYSASKGAAEIVAHAYRHSFFSSSDVAMATARAGNIVGGGDFADFRIVPDVVRAILAGESVRLRHPDAVRPWQHVLDAVAGYLRLGDALAREGSTFAEGWNFGPDPSSTSTVAQLVDAIIEDWRMLGSEVSDPEIAGGSGRPEREYLTLVSKKAESRLGWKSLLDFRSTMSWTAEWYYNAAVAKKAKAVTDAQIERFLALDAEATN